MLSAGPASCVCPTPDPCSPDFADGDGGVGPVGVDVNGTYVLLNIVPCQLDDLKEDDANEIEVRELLIKLDRALLGLPCQVHAGVGGVALGGARFVLHDGREVRVTVGASAGSGDVDADATNRRI